eukprot:TRINITY_DN62661_c0_g1_i1.p1 TRINITY_DN62661_c0_g1~~TRINITY_DN62661_c0_g1_i1.p1  ORF type:complete len:101 (-),score=11.94 TRINITY_DN62661_c0_g1_i1:675-977(-)
MCSQKEVQDLFLSWFARESSSAQVPEFPIAFGSLKRVHFLPLIDSLNARLSSWIAATLSFVGRLIPIKHVLSCIPLHTAVILPLSISICKAIERLLRHFL